jgi:hypothetical protein
MRAGGEERGTGLLGICGESSYIPFSSTDSIWGYVGIKLKLFPLDCESAVLDRGDEHTLG